MQCNQCSSNRVLKVSAKCADTFNAVINGKKTYSVPTNCNIGEEDYVVFNLCLNCGKCQGTFPVDKLDIEQDIIKCDTCGSDRVEASDIWKNAMYCVECGAIQ